MEKITKLSNLLAEMDEIGKEVNENGSDALVRNASIRQKISRLLSIHRRMTRSSTPTPSPARTQISTASDPLTTLERLNDFRTYLKRKLRTDMKVTVSQAHELASLEKECKRLQSSVGVVVAGLGGHFDSGRVTKLKEDGRNAIAKANEIRRRKIHPDVGEAVKKTGKELSESLKYLDRKSQDLDLIIKSGILKKPKPIKLESVCPSSSWNLEPRVPRTTNKLSLSRKRKGGLSN